MPEVTIKDIARLCGVGTSTVSRAINNHPAIRPETRARIWATIEQYGYIPNNSARNLKRTESNSVAVLVKGITNLMFNSMIKVFDEKLKKYKLSMILQHVEYEEDEVQVALKLIKEKRLKGIIFLGSNYYHAEGALEKVSVPFVLSTVGEIFEDEDLGRYCHVAVNDLEESYAVTNYLLAKGHRRIAILTAEEKDSSVGRLRLEGFLKAFRDRGLTPDARLICPVSDEFEHYSMMNGYVTTQKLLASGRPLTAIYAMADIMAVGAYRAVLESGRRIPEDISVIGFDGIELGDYLRPKLTTLVQPAAEIAGASIELLHSLMTGSGQKRNIIFKGKLTEKGSVRALD